MMSKPNMIATTQQDMMWHSGAPNVPQAHGAVSVVTTVYSNVPQYAGAAQSFNAAPVHPNSTPNVFSVGGGPPSSAAYVGAAGAVPKSATYCPDNSYPAYDHQTYQQPVPSDYPPAAPQHAALNAAQVAAAAVATATATAVAIDQSQFQQYHPNAQPGAFPNNGYSQVGVMPPNPYPTADPRMAPQRVSMPPAYLPAVRGARLQQANGRYPGGTAKGAAPAVPSFPNGQLQQSVPYGAPGSGQQSMMVSGQQRLAMPSTGGSTYSSMGPQSSYTGRMPHTAMRNPQYPMTPADVASVGGYPSQLPGYGHHAMQNVQLPNYQATRPNMMYGNMATTMPNNPTPPLTPAASTIPVAPPGYPTGSNGPIGGLPSAMADSKPAVNAQADDAEPRITFQVRDGILLQPFRLEHNAPVSQHVFILDDRTYHQLCTNPNLDLQLKCFHAEDKTMSNNWPHNANIQICVNGTPIAVRLVERPLYIKSLCQKQKNTLQIAVQQCCCSHLFLLTLVNRPTIETMVRQLVRQRLLSPDHCIEKIRSFFQSGEAAQMRNAEACGGNPDIVQMSINMSLKCPITMKRIELPARGQECRHPQCFDLRSYLAMNKERSTWLCPICKRLAMLDSLEIDQYVWGILTNLNNCDVEEVSIDGAAAWKPVVRQSTTGGTVKEENDVPCSSAKRFKSDPGASTNVCTWGQPNLQTPPSSVMMSNPAAAFGQQQHNQSMGMLSPYHAGGSPSAMGPLSNANPSTPAASNPHATPNPPVNGMPGSASFSGPNTPRQSMGPLTPHNSRCGPATPVTPQQPNPPSVGPPPRSVGNPPSVDNPNKGSLLSSVYGGQRQQQLQQQSSVDASFSGSAPYTPVSVSSAGSQQNSVPNATMATDAGSDFPDFTFDASDLLGSGDVAQPGTSLFNDPEELMKYLADDTDFGGFSTSGNALSTTSAFSTSDSLTAKQRSSGHTTNAQSDAGSRFQASSSGPVDGGRGVSADLTTMDDILSFLDK